jgi:hypothetical protein
MPHRTHPSLARIGHAALGLALLAGLPAQAIVGGTATSAFAHVGQGVQITNSWVLTARHLGLTVGGSYSNGWGMALVAARYDLGSGAFPADDLTLLRLASPISAAPDLGLLATLLPAGLLATPLTVTITTDNNQSPRGFAVTTLTGVLDQLDPDGTGGSGPVDVHYLVSAHGANQLPHVEGGDSGGGLFLGAVADSTGALLMGINSALLLNGQSTPVGSAFVQLASQRSWIDQTMANDLADSQVANWVFAPVPEPAAWALLLAGGAALAGQARRRPARSARQRASLP